SSHIVAQSIGFLFSSRRRHTRSKRDWSSDVCSSDLETTDDGERADLYEQAQQIVLEDYYVLPLYDQQNHFLYSADVQGMGEASAIAAPQYYNVWLDQ